MTLRKHSPIHDKWHRIVEGQIRNCMNCHPEWFNFTTQAEKSRCINSLAKRIVGEIVSDAKLETKTGLDVR